LWFLDDGDPQGRISTDKFFINDVLFLKDMIKNKYGIQFNIRHQYNRPQHKILTCPKSQNNKLLAIFKSSGAVIPCVAYKLDLV